MINQLNNKKELDSHIRGNVVTLVSVGNIGYNQKDVDLNIFKIG